MNHFRWILAAAFVAGLSGWGIWEHRGRLGAERRYWSAVESEKQLKRRYADAISEHQQLSNDLTAERRHSQELSEALLQARAQMEETVGRLNEEMRVARELQGRLTVMQQHMEQLEGELSIALEPRQTSAGAKAKASGMQVELERVVVGQGGAAPLQGRVISVHPEWNFVIVSLGWDAVKIGEQLSILRDDKVLAKARVERIQEGVCAASLLPEWKINDVNVNDVARVL